jgi:hypothetical protein
MKTICIELTIEGVLAKRIYGYYKDRERIIKLIKAQELQFNRYKHHFEWEIIMIIKSRV